MYMKRILFFMLMFIGSMTASAQQGLHINELFEGRIIPQERMIETRVRGRTLSKYRLSFYHSVRLTATNEEARLIRSLAEKDSQKNKSSISESKSEGKLTHVVNTYTLKVQVQPQGDKNCFLCYQERQAGAKKPIEITVIYLEGNVRSVHELEELLNKN